MSRISGSRNRARLALIAGLALISTAAVRADTLYKIQPIFKVGDTVGGIKTTQNDLQVGALNDAGEIAFIARPSTHPTGRPTAAFLWEKGVITKIAGVPADAPGGDKIGAYFRPFVNNRDGSVLLTVSLGVADPNSGPFAFYRWAAGKLTPVLVPGQEIPGGKLQTIFGGAEAASFPNDAGQQVFLARLEDGNTAAYLLDLDNSIHLVLPTGASTDLGHVTSIADDSGGGVGLNNADIGAGLNNKGRWRCRSASTTAPGPLSC